MRRALRVRRGDGAALTELRISSAHDTRVDKEPPLTRDEAKVLLEKAQTSRDRLIVATLLYTGIRPSELIALTESNIRLDRNPPVVEIRGSGHDPKRPKSAAGYRDIP